MSLFREYESFFKPSLHKGSIEEVSLEEERISLPLLDNSLSLENTHLNASESGTDSLATGTLKAYKRTQQRTDPNSIVQPPCQLQSSGSDPTPLFGKDYTYVSPNIIDNTVDNTNLLIAVRKGVRAYKNILLQNLSLSPTYCAFVSSLSSIFIPRSWKERLADPG